MADGPFDIYRNRKLIHSFPNEAAVRSYLEAERDIWRPLLDEVANDTLFSSLGRQSGSVVSREDFELLFDRLIASLQSSRSFRDALGQYSQGKSPLPPASSSLEGRLILSLIEEDRRAEAKWVYLATLRADGVFQDNGQRQLLEPLQAGQQLIRGAIAADAMFSKKPGARELGAAKRSASAALKALEAEVEKAKDLNAGHASDLAARKAELDKDISSWREAAGRMKAILSRRERNRQARHEAWLHGIQQDIDTRLIAIEARAESSDASAKARHAEREAEFEALKDLFHTQLRLRAPVALWGGRETHHRKASKVAFIAFVALSVLAIGLGLLVPHKMGDLIAASFYTQVCNAADPTACTREFSAKGPLMLSGLLVVMSVTLWMVRLQYRIYLSERHLALDASEKKAFAETYLAMKEGANVDPASEAIVLASLFRPTQDGIIKDDESGVDLSAAAIIARQLGRPGA